MESKKPKLVEESKKEPEVIRLTSQETIDLIAKVSHKTWMRQAAQNPKWEGKDLPKEPFLDDHKRAADTLVALGVQEPATRQAAVELAARVSHDAWLAFQKEKTGTIEGLDSKPQPHDYERAEDIIKALEEKGLLSFK
ncbi:hypothetical protein A3A03_02715 [Candidatus Nomurabacteria bacterium RIFCSPLOWO2_01_FULL_40_18]|uniref:Ryanodine receptor Ryr domain-containing protein n=1 Tax=Candidatus Nomurabacteria bacterium RIFCSPLOWO2_01_FULL_40_18 TaxID=1801773 RepID=A0A1F6XKR4_9BACT|nr:MAG: hypothetical protein A3A03_02715 [Candidatus Nomurabacteria bacterium RIFCSPLOWO2_01_FULL_40_18]